MRRFLPVLAGAFLALAAVGAVADPGRDAILAALTAEAKQADPGVYRLLGRARRGALERHPYRRQARHAVLHHVSYVRPHQSRPDARRQGDRADGGLDQPQALY